MIEGPHFVIVIEHPLAEVVGDVESPVVVAAELVVDDDNGVVDAREAVSIFAKKDIAALKGSIL